MYAEGHKVRGAPKLPLNLLDALRTYAARLDKVYGKNAFRRFSRADMQVLEDKMS